MGHFNMEQYNGTLDATSPYKLHKRTKLIKQTVPFLLCPMLGFFYASQSE